MRAGQGGNSHANILSIDTAEAAKIGVDPLELRCQNCYRPGATTPTGQEPEVFSFPQMFDKLRPLYRAAKEKARAESTPERKKGVGIPLGIYGAGLDGVDTAEVWAELTRHGVTMYATWHDHGQGADIGMVGTAHEALRALEIEPEQIKLVLNDTGLMPDSGPAGGSRSQVVVGNAIKKACANLIEAMRRSDGSLRTYAELVTDGIPLRHVGKWTTVDGVACDDTGQGKLFGTYIYAVFMAEVAVDMKTGKATVEGYTAIADVGKINNRLAVDGQMYGGIAQGIGLALSEDYEDIHQHTTMIACGLPYARDIPDKFDLYYIETPREAGPFGASGVGEIPLTSTHVPVLNAIKDATGVRITRLPARPEKILVGIQGASNLSVWWNSPHRYVFPVSSPCWGRDILHAMGW
jgi:aldehyde oxidoreductase